MPIIQSKQKMRVGSSERKKKGCTVGWGMSHCVLERLSGLGVQWSKFSSLLRAVGTLPPE